MNNPGVSGKSCPRISWSFRHYGYDDGDGDTQGVDNLRDVDVDDLHLSLLFWVY